MKTKSAEFASQTLVRVSAVGIKNSRIPVISEVLPHADLFKLLCCKSFLNNIFFNFDGYLQHQDTKRQIFISETAALQNPNCLKINCSTSFNTGEQLAYFWRL